ncbi:MAG: MBL fold metallo-hydrolase [Gammaproteobacteria bacterium]|nr:MBL fold metallo-hydrolase [Gammaproteobacteria bacterium]
MRARQFIPALLLALLAAGCGGKAEAPADAAPEAGVENRGGDTANWWDSLPRAEWSLYEKIVQDQDWFEVYRIADGVYAIYEPGQFEEVISFLIEGSEKALLFDTGLGIGDMRRVVEQLTTLDVVVLNSHTHYDHIGGNHQFEFIYGRDTAYTRGRMRGSSTGDVAEFISDGWIWKELPDGFVATEYRSQPFLISEIVDEGSVIDVGGRRLEVLVTPGHAPDSICLIDRANRLLFTGDTFYLAPLYTHIPGSSFDDYVASAARLAGLAGDIDSAMTSHNVPVVDGSYMTALGKAFADIVAGSATDYVVTDGNREYQFDGFSVIVREEDVK